MESHLPLTIGRYELHAELASGGMAVVHLGRLRGDAGFARAVAIKRLHRQYVGDPELSALLLDEARLASRLQHPNVVAPQDLVISDGEIFVVMEYVHGLTLAALVREARARGEAVPVPIASRIVSDILAGLHAAHEARDDQGRPLALVHRDISPQNVMVGVEGLARVLDFGIAQAAFRSQTTREGQLRAKLAYAAPEHVLDHEVDRRADVYSTAVVLWELLTLERLFAASNESALLARVLEQVPQPVSKLRPDLPSALDALLASALSKTPGDRPSSADEFAVAIERVVSPATHREVARWVAALGGEALDRLAERKAEVLAGGPISESPTSSKTSTTFAQSINTRTSEGAVPRVETSSTTALPHARRKSWSRARVAAVVGVVFGVLALGPSVLGRKLSLGSRASATPAVAGDPIASGATAPPAPLESVPAAASQALAAEPATSGRSPKAAQDAAPQKTAAPSPPPTRAAWKPRPVPSADGCSQLTEIDSQGIRRVKRQCLR